MNSSLLKLGALGGTLLSCPAFAVGLGEITLHSRVGEVLRAEVPILTGGRETLDGACFGLAPLHGSELPVIANAHLALRREGADYRLIITGHKPVVDPVFVLGLRAHCGIDLQRDYVLMPAEPLMAAAVALPLPAGSDSPPAEPKRKYRIWQTVDGDSLESIAEALVPDNPARQRRTLAALQRANPERLPGQRLAGGENIRIPALQRAAPSQQIAATTPRPAPLQPSFVGPAKTRKASPAAPGDRVVLGAAPDDPAPTPQPTPANGTTAQIEERILKLETTLHLLNQEVDKLNKVLELTAETLATRQKLELAQAAQLRTPEAVMPAARGAPPEADLVSGNWPALLFGALIGGTLAATLAQLFGRRREPPLPLPPRPVRAEPAPAKAAPYGPVDFSREPGSPGTPTAIAAVDLPLDRNFSTEKRPETIAVEFNEIDSAIELAEIMLSYGRVKGAAETLAQYIRQNAPDNVQPWLMLADLYRRGNMRSEFDKLARHIHENFNLHIATWEESTTPVSGLKSLESYAHIVDRLTSRWGKQECMDYLHDLIHDCRAGQRSGFPLEVVEEIVLLMRLLEDGYALKRPA